MGFELFAFKKSTRSKNLGKNVAPHHPDPKNLALNHPDPK
jgi:hypothetical protein